MTPDQEELPIAPFTQEQLEYISLLIKKELLRLKTESYSAPSYHSLPQIRQLVTKNLDLLYNEFGSTHFRLPALAHVLSRLTTLLPGDHELQNNGTRWENQVGQVVLCEHHKWPNKFNPFVQVRSNMRGTYRLVCRAES